MLQTNYPWTGKKGADVTVTMERGGPAEVSQLLFS